MATMTTIARMPGNWDVWEGSEDDYGLWEPAIQAAFDAKLAEAFPDGSIYRVGDEIYGPATLKFYPTAYDDDNHCWRYERDTPDRDEIAGRELLANPDWVLDMLADCGDCNDLISEAEWAEAAEAAEEAEERANGE